MGAAEDIFKHFKKYVLRSKVEFRLLNDVHVHNKPPDNATSHDIKYIIDTPDPRTSSIGSRILAASIIGSTSSNDDCHYHMMRMDQGVLEGITELPPGQCLPLEVNLDYMNGVSFSKGCYLGQELTSRTHHTGVVRKRVLPLKLSQSPSNFIWGTPVHSLSGKPLGKVFSCYGRSAVALLRMPNLNEGENVNILCSDESIISAQWKKPDWWPDEK
jgi:folate-binding protein YgfZ